MSLSARAVLSPGMGSTTCSLPVKPAGPCRGGGWWPVAAAPSSKAAPGEPGVGSASVCSDCLLDTSPHQCPYFLVLKLRALSHSTRFIGGGRGGRKAISAVGQKAWGVMLDGESEAQDRGRDTQKAARSATGRSKEVWRDRQHAPVGQFPRVALTKDRQSG